MPGYFKISMSAAQAIARAGSPEALAAFLVLQEAAFGKKRQLTAAGAKAISKYTGYTNWRSRRLLKELESLRFGERGELGLLEPTTLKVKNADVRSLCTWPGEYAYLPSTFVRLSGGMPSPLRMLCKADADSETARDALLVMLYLYATIDYGESLGANASTFFYQDWRTEGTVEHDDFETDLGFKARIRDVDIWAVAPPRDDSWSMPSALTELIADTERAFKAFFLLLKNSMVSKVAVVTFGTTSYPLWVFSPHLRRSLPEHFINASLAKDMDRLARRCGGDPDNLIITTALSEEDPFGSGIFFCLAPNKPTVRTLVIPQWHAPTPNNLDGLNEQSRITKNWSHKVAQLSLKAA